MKNEIDAIDRRIIRLLQADGKRKIRAIAETLKMSNTPVFERIKRLESEGFIKGYTAIVDNEKLGFGLTAFCSVSLQTHKKEFIQSFEKEVKKLPEVLETYHMAGAFDYLLKVHTKSMKEYQEFISNKLSSIEGIGQVQSYFVMTEIKNENILPI